MSAFIAVYLTCCLVAVCCADLDGWARDRRGLAKVGVGVVGLATSIAFIGAWLAVFQ